MAALANRVGIAKGSLYNYFDSKEELYLYVCRDGLERSRQAVYGTLDPDWDTYRQVDHIFCQGARFVQSHPEYLILYTNIASAGMARFAEQISQEVEHYTADHLKRVLRRDMAAGIVRDDLDVTLVAFTINSLYISGPAPDAARSARQADFFLYARRTAQKLICGWSTLWRKTHRQGIRFSGKDTKNFNLCAWALLCFWGVNNLSGLIYG